MVENNIVEDTIVETAGRASAGEKRCIMNEIRSVSFQEVPGGLRVHVRKNPKSSSAGKLKKRLPYNFKQISRQIMQAKTPDAARSLIAKVQVKLSGLYKKLRSGEYGDSEVAAAIIHAAAMERIAKRKVRHLEEEEAAERGSGAANAPGEEGESGEKDELRENLEGNEAISGEMMRKIMQEIEEMEEEIAGETLSELQDMISCAGKDMSKEEIEEIRRKHRNEEERQLTNADLKYLRALFHRLEQEKKQASSGAGDFGGNESAEFTCGVDCMPEVEMTDLDIGGTVDVNV